MTDILIGRRFEQQQLQKAFDSKESEFIAIYGRRRIGKTFLILNFFERKSCVFFYVSGINHSPLELQLKEFKNQIEQIFYADKKGTKLQVPENWMDALQMLTDAVNIFAGRRKVILFFDEFPWMATHKSGLLQALDYYWNRYWTRHSKIKLIICGSAATWIIDNILNNKGGLHNRVTLRMRLEPFTLYETKCYLKQRGIHFSQQHILQLYLCIGGIPYYLRFINKKLSAIQNINQLCFHKKGILTDEFNNLFSSLFDQAEIHEQIIKLIASKRGGMDRVEIENTLSYKGGSLSKRLKELEEAGFISAFTPYGKVRGVYYKVIDEYTLFYLTWIMADTKNRLTKEITDEYWEYVSQTSAWKAWSGYAFEAICYKHIKNIQMALKIPSGTTVTTWRYIPGKKEKTEGAQIDLLFDRLDGIVQLCEIKYCSSPYKINKDYAKVLIQKSEVYQKITKTKKQIFISMITSCHLQKNMYSEEIITSEATLDDLFEA